MRSTWKNRVIFGLLLVALGMVACNRKETNPYTGRAQAIALTPQQEIALGLQSTPQMIQRYGGLYSDSLLQGQVERVGQKLIHTTLTKSNPYPFKFHLLADPNTLNAFSLPGGQIFITYGLLSRLENEDQLAAVLGHEIGHVLGRHATQRITERNLLKSDSKNANAILETGEMEQSYLLINNPEDELESDALAVQLVLQAGYDPNEMIKVMELFKLPQGPKFQNTHPDALKRVEKIKEHINKYLDQ
ncbi:MAG: M48 family metalloprotease [Flavobacteriaceae bacterium]